MESKVEKQVVMKSSTETLIKFIVVVNGTTSTHLQHAKRTLNAEVQNYTETLRVPYNGFWGQENPFVYLVLQENL